MPCSMQHFFVQSLQKEVNALYDIFMKSVTQSIYMFRTPLLVDSRMAHRATKHFSNAHVVVLPDSGHMAQMEHPEFVEAAWDRFIAPTLNG